MIRAHTWHTGTLNDHERQHETQSNQQTNKNIHRQIPVEAEAELEEQRVREQRRQQVVDRRRQARGGVGAAERPEVEEEGLVAGGYLFWGIGECVVVVFGFVGGLVSVVLLFGFVWLASRCAYMHA